MIIYRKTHRNTKKLLDLKEIETAINYLTELVHSEVRCPKSLKILKNNMYKITKATAKGLIKEFGSPDHFFSVLISEDSSFDNAILKCLTINLGVSKKAKYGSFFFFSIVKSLKEAVQLSLQRQ